MKDCLNFRINLMGKGGPEIEGPGTRTVSVRGCDLFLVSSERNEVLGTSKENVSPKNSKWPNVSFSVQFLLTRGFGYPDLSKDLREFFFCCFRQRSKTFEKRQLFMKNEGLVLSPARASNFLRQQPRLRFQFLNFPLPRLQPLQKTCPRFSFCRCDS